MSNEVWKRIAGFEDSYEVSNFGSVRSLDRPRRQKLGSFSLLKGVLRKPGSDKDGYLILSLAKDGVKYPCRVACLVAEAFLGPRPSGMQVCHNDGIKTNNRVDNLRYDTPKGNVADKVRHGTHFPTVTVRGSAKGHAKLHESQIPSIRSDRRTLAAIAAEYGVSINTVSSVKLGKTWVHA